MTPPQVPQQFAFEAAESDDGERLDRFLAGRMPDMSRSRLKSLIKEGHAVQAGRTIVEPNLRVKPGDRFELTVPAAEDPVPKGEDIPLDIVFEDAHLIVVDKPAGLVVHPAAGNWQGTLVNALIGHCGDSLSGIGGVKRPGIVHRLDKDTSGLMVVAKSDAAHRGLADQFADHGRSGPLERAYTALVWGVPQPRKGRIEAALARKTENRQKIAVVSEGGKHAATRYEVRHVFAGADSNPLGAEVVCRLETGRTHQIRVHLAHIGHPLLGDATYGAGFKTKSGLLADSAREAVDTLGRQALHAHLLGFAHPITGETLSFTSPLPADLSQTLKHLTAH